MMGSGTPLFSKIQSAATTPTDHTTMAPVYYFLQFLLVIGLFLGFCEAGRNKTTGEYLPMYGDDDSCEKNFKFTALFSATETSNPPIFLAEGCDDTHRTKFHDGVLEAKQLIRMLDLWNTNGQHQDVIINYTSPDESWQPFIHGEFVN